MSELTGQLVVLDSTINHAIGVVDNVALYVWRRLTTPEALPHIIQAFANAASSGAGRLANYGLVEAEAGLPDAEMRARLARIMRDASAIMDASAMTFEGSGFRASAVRTAAMGLALMARQPYPHRVFGSTHEAAHWMVAQMRRRNAPSPEAEAVGGAMQALRDTPPGSRGGPGSAPRG